MEFNLIKMLAFLRPILFVDTGIAFSSLNLFEWAGILFSGITIAAFAMRAATYKNLNWSVTDLLIGGFVFWCIAIYFIYFDKAHANVLAKLVIPLLTYVVAKSVIPGKEQYLKMIWLLILGFSIPLVASALLILHGGGLEKINYWTGEHRYEGAYNSVHDMAHNAAFLLMVIWLYLLLLKEKQTSVRQLSVATNGFLVLLVLTAMYLLYKGSVRTTVAGLVVFATVLFAMYYKRPLLIVATAIILASSFMLSENIQKRFFPEGAWAEQASNFDVTDYGSARPKIWASQIKAFLGLPIDQQLAGIGIGNNLARDASGEDSWILSKDTHNDFFHVMVHTGIVGLLLFVVLQVAILRKIVTMDSSLKSAFFAIFAAVTIMNVVSNSYVSRFGLAQMLYLVLSYIELRPEGTKEGAQPSSEMSYRARQAAEPVVRPLARTTSGTLAARRKS